MAVWDSYIHNSGSTLNYQKIQYLEYLPGNPTGLQGILEDSWRIFKITFQNSKIFIDLIFLFFGRVLVF